MTEDDEARMRLPTRPGGQKHFRDARDLDIEETQTAIEAAIKLLVPVEGASGYPSVDRLRAASGNAFGRSTAYRVIGLIHTAQDAWRARERAAGREIPPKLAKQDADAVQSTASAAILEKALADVAKGKAKLTRALDGIDEERTKADRAKKVAEDMARHNQRLMRGVFDMVWGDVEAEAGKADHDAEEADD